MPRTEQPVSNLEKGATVVGGMAAAILGFLASAAILFGVFMATVMSLGGIDIAWRAGNYEEVLKFFAIVGGIGLFGLGLLIASMRIVVLATRTVTRQPDPFEE